jgi:maltooligosyltrehalose synthase
LRLPTRGPQPGSDGWGDTVLILPQSEAAWRDVLSADHLVKVDGYALPVALLLGERPVAVLMAPVP